MDAVKTIGCILDGRALPAQIAENMMGVPKYRPKKVGVGTGRHVPEGGGVIRQEATPSSALHKTLQMIQVTLVQEPPPRWRRIHESSNRCCPGAINWYLAESNKKPIPGRKASNRKA